MICASSVTDFHPLATWVGASFSRLTLQRYNSVPRDVKRHPRFGGDLTLRGLVIFRTKSSTTRLSAAKNLSAQAKYYIADVYRFFGPLRMTRNGSSCLLAILCRLTIAKSGFCKDNSCFVQQGGGKGRTTGAHTNAITVITDYR